MKLNDAIITKTTILVPNNLKKKKKKNQNDNNEKHAFNCDVQYFLYLFFGVINFKFLADL
jgi:hypothetical protein